MMRSLVVKRSIIVAGHKTSISLEEPFWAGLKEIAQLRRTTLSDLVSSIDAERPYNNLSSNIRMFVLEYYRNRLNEGAAQASFAEVVPRRAS